MLGDSRLDAGRLFQTRGRSTAKDQSPNIVLVDGTCSFTFIISDDDDDLRPWPEVSGTHCPMRDLEFSADRYRQTLKTFLFSQYYNVQRIRGLLRECARHSLSILTLTFSNPISAGSLCNQSIRHASAHNTECNETCNAIWQNYSIVGGLGYYKGALHSQFVL